MIECFNGKQEILKCLNNKEKWIIEKNSVDIAEYKYFTDSYCIIVCRKEFIFFRVEDTIIEINYMPFGKIYFALNRLKKYLNRKEDK